ncbi:hypothetical protein [Corynebacterium halotolerans]|uniref:Uncharacterized protein n=1 Tax=Corynebacterium halotolerans YIM 70093 = DSM 44683 TaxID=1121362 RepID=M1NTL1_9CORY|nr:hypothetical protein [Corynebacterium halotolerans]AGF72817.1 hypothetical protein A605_09075 [Corynebacterium halotolerans YIM 70093 = DSM 44683]
MVEGRSEVIPDGSGSGVRAIGAGLVVVLYLAHLPIGRVIRLFVPERPDLDQQGTHQLPPTPYF